MPDLNRPDQSEMAESDSQLQLHAVADDREYLKVWVPVLVLAVAAVWVTFLYVEPAPPEQVRIAAGSKDGAYYRHANQYREVLAESGVTLEVVETEGSIENLQRLQSGDCQVGFAQGGTAEAMQGESIQSLASLYFEPLWVFHAAGFELDHLTRLRGRRVAIGEERSGTHLLALELLADNEINSKNTDLRTMSNPEAVRQLQSGNIDAAFFVSSTSAPYIPELISDSSIQLLSFRRHLAYRTRHRFLSKVTLGEGTVDLAKNIPPRDIDLLAPAAVLVGRADLHHAIVSLLLKAVEKVHAGGGLFEAPEEFPSTKFTDFPMRERARRHLRNGPSFLHRYLPFWAASTIDRLKILLLPLLTLLIPLFKIAPPLYRWRVRRKIYLWYRDLRALDLTLADPSTPVDGELLRDRLQQIEAELHGVTVPLAYMDEFYHLRLHVEMIGKRLDDLPAAAAGSDTKRR